MKLFHNLLGLIFSFALMAVLLITSIEAVTYWTPSYYEKEYTKYQVLEAVDMEMDDLQEVTDEMMAYLRGHRKDHHVPTIGETWEFFNEREIAHMEDVRGLFLAAITIRRICFLVMAACAALLIVLKAETKRILPRMICGGTVLFFTILALLAGIISTDFSKYFIIFHKIFFTNDLWILEPASDLLINIVPEPFFVDTAVRIAVTYGISVIAVFSACVIWLKKQKKQK